MMARFGRAEIFVALLGSSACATAVNPANSDADQQLDARVVDARVADAQVVDGPGVDAKIDSRVDAPPPPPIDAPPPPPIDAPPPPVDACVPRPRQILVNGNLEATASWRQRPNDPTFDIITTPPSGMQTASGTKLAWFGGAPSAVDELSQDIVVPATTTTFNLTAKFVIGTEETSTATQYDKLVVTIRTAGGTVLATLGTLSNLNRGTAYATFSVNAPMTFAGQTVKVMFRATTDNSKNTNFFVDDIAVNVTACP